MFSSKTTRLAGPGSHITTFDGGSNSLNGSETRAYTHKYPFNLGMGVPTAVRHKQRRVRVTAIINQKADATTTTYTVEEVSDGDESSDEDDYRSSPVHNSITASKANPIGQPSESQTSSTSLASSPIPSIPSLSPPSAPRIPFPPSPTMSTSASTISSPTTLFTQLAKNAGLGLELPDWVHHKHGQRNAAIWGDGEEGSCNLLFTETALVDPHYPEMFGIGLGIMTDNGPLRIGSGSVLEEGDQAYNFKPFESPEEDVEDTESESEEEAHYYLPSDLFSSEPVMSETEFKASVKSWSERRQRASSCAL